VIKINENTTTKIDYPENGNCETFETGVSDFYNAVRIGCPVCKQIMDPREEEVDNDNFASGKEKIIKGWDCKCGISLDMYER
jgi:hypothetical protein